jgi:hypothetical protein
MEHISEIKSVTFSSKLFTTFTKGENKWKPKLIPVKLVLSARRLRKILNP